VTKYKRRGRVRNQKKEEEEDGGNGKQPAATARTAADAAAGATSGSRKGTHLGSGRATPTSPVLHPLQPFLALVSLSLFLLLLCDLIVVQLVSISDSFC
jgi:hypothetical protein